ncbi:MAG: ABC transporter ATP-binding protein/permease [Mogibacterium sp.]|nr:ABC transporter ATP-binding protein/permease [Mogibacterium sp.]
MLELRNVSKNYKTGAEVVNALRSVSLAFRESEFVSVLGPSGCGKTTMLNILGGLDQYTSGDLIINGVSTKEYRSSDWDAYRNDTIGFVFQSYNLISHQSVLRNVELALTLSGVSRGERRRRAIEALEQVGLGDQMYKRPAQMSGGQVQRVAIARALINNPDIILADEPTGALDTETSAQVMDVLKRISATKLVIMVTHNPELAEKYSTRIIRLTDGRVTSDSNPYDAGSASAAGLGHERHKKRRRNKSMSMLTALSLSLNNLMTKKARTLLTAFAGSIGIIGIALILSVSNGFQRYIDKLEEDTLASYPLTIQSETADMTSMITAFMANAQDTKGEDADGSIHEQQIMTDLLASVGSNDLAAFKKYVDSNMDDIKGWFNAYEYGYGLSVYIYSTDLKYGPLRVSPGSIMQSYMNGFQQNNFSMMNSDVFFQLMDNEELLKSQYKVLAGKWPEKYDELLLVLDSEDQLNDYIVYTLGLRDPQELKDMINDVMSGEEVENNNEQLEWTYEDFIGKEFALVNSCDTYRQNSSYDVWEDMTGDEEYMEDLIKNSEKLHITGIVCAKEKNSANAMDSGVGYLPELTMHMIDSAKESDIVKLQLANKDIDVFSGKSFEEVRSDSGEGLGFEDMISIDEDKLARALGGDMDQAALQKELQEISRNATTKISDGKATDKISNAVNEDLKKAFNAINSDLESAAAKNADAFTLTNELINTALKDNLFSKKNPHAAILNNLLKGYAKALKGAKDSINQGIAAANPELIAEQFAQQLSAGGIPFSKDEAKALIDSVNGKSEAEVKSMLAAMMPMLGEEELTAFAAALMQASAASNMKAEDILKTALSGVSEAMLSSDELQDGIGQYALAIVAGTNVGKAVGDAVSSLSDKFQVDPAGIADAFTMKMDEEELTRLITAYASGGGESGYDSNLRKLGYANLSKPTSISFYLKDFEAKENFLKFIDDYNRDMQDAGDEDLVISYTDITGVLIKSVKTITNAVSYVLIAFVAISLIVSSIMIGVITYISVLERTKEIGILRAIGASKRDISRIFNAETIIVGLCAGVMGIGSSLLLLIPINKLLIGLTKIAALKAILPFYGGTVLIIISVLLTVIAGLIPSGMAARKDPVVALRTE